MYKEMYDLFLLYVRRAPRNKKKVQNMTEKQAKAIKQQFSFISMNNMQPKRIQERNCLPGPGYFKLMLLTQRSGTMD